MKKTSMVNMAFAAILAASAFNSQAVRAQSGYYGHYFTDTATAANTGVLYSDQTTLNNPAINADSNAIILFTANWTAGSVYNAVTTGVYYYPTDNVWSVFNEDRGHFPIGYAANVLVPSAHGNAFVSVAGTVANNYFDIDNAASNANPGALVFITHNWMTGFGVGDRIYDTVQTGVWYDASNSKWSIYNERRSVPMPQGIAFNVFVADTAGGAAFIHVSSSSNVIAGNDNTAIDNAFTNGNPAAVLVVTHNYNGGPVAKYDSVPVGVYYDQARQKWCIFHEDRSPMDTAVAYNVLVANAPVHTGILSVGANNAGLGLYPNPAANQVHISYNQQESAEAELELFSSDGRLAEVIFSGMQEAGSHSLSCSVARFPAGSYYLSLNAGGIISHFPFIILK